MSWKKISKYWYIFLTEADLFDLYRLLTNGLHLRKSVFIQLYEWRDQNPIEIKNLLQRSTICVLDHIQLSLLLCLGSLEVIYRDLCTLWFIPPFWIIWQIVGSAGVFRAGLHKERVQPLPSGPTTGQSREHQLNVAWKQALCTFSWPIIKPWNHNRQELVSTGHHAEIS